MAPVGARRAMGVRHGGQLRQAWPGDYGRAAARCAPKALRRSGRAHATVPAGASRPACPPGRPPDHPHPVSRLRAAAGPAPPGARRAPRALEDVEKVLTGRAVSVLSVSGIQADVATSGWHR